MPVHASEPPAGAAGPQHSPAVDLLKAQQLSSKAPKRKRNGTTEAEAVDCDPAAAVQADTALATAAKKRQQQADAGLVNPGPSKLPKQLSDVEMKSDEQSDSGEGEQSDSEGDAESEEGGQQPRSHPYGVQPWGNFYLSQVPEIRTAGLGVLSGLADDVILGMLELLSAADLARLGLVSQAFYCFAHTTDLWKGLVLQELGGDFNWCGTWRETYLAHAAPGYKLGSHKPLQVSGFYSDFLHQPWFCATTELQQHWLEVDNIDRRTGLTPEQFRTQYESRNRPVLLTDGAADWPALQKWDQGYLAAAFAGRPVIVGNASWRFGSYLSYCRNGCELDEMPLYMFDKAFASACPHLVNDYSVPSVFTEDLFGVLGEEKRPDYRWLIIGPHRSGSSFHVDPNATCAWNAVVSGAKKWILFPPGTPPPGVHPSPDGADVAAPVSIIEWFLNFYDEARESKNPPIECICRPGEVLYVPRGWWHCVLNLGHTVAVTQNYVSSTGLQKVLDFLKPGRVELVSGCGMEDRCSLHDRFVAALEQQRPEVLAAVRQQQEQQRQQRQAEHRLSELFKSTRHHHHHDQQQQQQQQGGDAARADLPASTVADDAVADGFAVGGGGFIFGFPLNGADSSAAEQGAGEGPAGGTGFSFGFTLAAEQQ